MDTDRINLKSLVLYYIVYYKLLNILDVVFM